MSLSLAMSRRTSHIALPKSPHILRSNFRSQFRFKYRFRSRFKDDDRGRKRRVLLAAASSLSPLAFIELGTQNSEDGKTGEELMLDASIHELEESVPSFLAGSSRIRRRIYFLLDAYLLEPIYTGLRFLHLLAIFVPVVVTMPVIFLGPRVKERANERAGTLWWYRMLRWAMEKAGATFIKASHLSFQKRKRKKE